MRREPLTKPTSYLLRTTSNISYSLLPTWTFHKVWRLTSPQQYLVSDDFSLRETRKQSKRPVLLPNQTSLRLISCIHVRFFETSLKLLWVTIVRTTRQVPDSQHIRGSSVLYPVEPIVHLSERLLCVNRETLTVTPWMLVLSPPIPW